MLSKLLWANILLKIVDVGTTGYAIEKIGLLAEQNPIVRYLVGFCGTGAALFLILILHSLLVYSLYRKKSRWALIFVFVLLFATAANNIYWIVSHV